jgi:hypothetical protein
MLSGISLDYSSGYLIKAQATIGINAAYPNPVKMIQGQISWYTVYADLK